MPYTKMNIMGQLPDRQTTEPGRPRPVRVIHISVQPKTWLGKLLATILAAALMLIAFFLSIILFVMIACIIVVAIIYVIWASHRAGRRPPDQVIEAEVKSRDID